MPSDAAAEQGNDRGRRTAWPKVGGGTHQPGAARATAAIPPRSRNALRRSPRPEATPPTSASTRIIEMWVAVPGEAGARTARSRRWKEQQPDQRATVAVGGSAPAQRAAHQRGADHQPRGQQDLPDAAGSTYPSPGSRGRSWCRGRARCCIAEPFMRRASRRPPPAGRRQVRFTPSFWNFGSRSRRRLMITMPVAKPDGRDPEDAELGVPVRATAYELLQKLETVKTSIQKMPRGKLAMAVKLTGSAHRRHHESP